MESDKNDIPISGNSADDDEVSESNISRRLSVLEGDVPDEGPVIEDSPKTVREKFANFFYHYKWPVIVIGVFAIIMTVCIVQLATRKKADILVMYAGPAVLTPEQINAVEESFDTIANEPGKTHSASLLDLTVYTEQQIEDIKKQSAEEGEPVAINSIAIYNSRQRFSAEITVGDTCIILVSPEMYKSVHEAGGFMKLAEITDTLPEGVEAYDDSAVILSSTNFGKKFAGVKDLPEDTLLCMRKLKTMSVFTGVQKAQESHAFHLEIFRKILSY
ncbi:MAG: hypothetical protein J5933_00515 [Clostridia bacterium]|nr:hypothetical protein [Clostridia bacterium]